MYNPARELSPGPQPPLPASCPTMFLYIILSHFFYIQSVFS